MYLKHAEMNDNNSSGKDNRDEQVNYISVTLFHGTHPPSQGLNIKDTKLEGGGGGGGGGEEEEEGE